MSVRTTRFALAALCALAAGSSLASSIVPAQPSAFDPVNLRMTVDSCSFQPGTVHVAAAGGTFQVSHRPNACLVAGTPEVVDIRLGTLAPGDYRVDVFASADTKGTPVESLRFTVADRPEPAVFPAIPKPLTDYSGLWWNAQESGWGLSITQSPANVVFGALFVYGAGGQPEWFTLQGGRWEGATRWSGTLYRTTGPTYAAALYDPHAVVLQSAGTASLDFTQVPGEEGRARFTFTTGGATVSKTISRMAF